MEALSEYIVVIVMAICLAVGYIIKHFLPMDNKWIPLIMGVLGIVINIWVSGWAFTPQILLGGLASGLAATGAFELIKNMAGRQK
ncbi:MAG: phage holin family protein [Clostridiales bacterium]|nr:phage holin family protein [Clostridiales bacterium]